MNHTERLHKDLQDQKAAIASGPDHGFRAQKPKPTDTMQDDLAKMRASIAGTIPAPMTQSQAARHERAKDLDVAEGGRFAAEMRDSVVGRAGQPSIKIRAAVPSTRAPGVAYKDDTKTKGEAHASQSAADFRVAEVTCPTCGVKTEIHQSLPHGGEEWCPNEVACLKNFGWQTSGDRWFCGQYCMKAYIHKMADHGGGALPPVVRINDAGYARRMYAEPAAASTPSAASEAAPAPVSDTRDTTTPAAPPQHGNGRRR